MKLTIDGVEKEYRGVAGFFIGILVYLFAAFIVFWTFLVTAVVLIGTALLLLSPFILIALALVWLL